MANLQAVGGAVGVPTPTANLNERLSRAASGLTESLIRIEAVLSRVEGSPAKDNPTVGAAAPLAPLTSNVGYLENLTDQFFDLARRLEQIA